MVLLPNAHRVKIATNPNMALLAVKVLDAAGVTSTMCRILPVPRKA